MEKSMAEGSQTFEQDLARLINTGVITRDEGLAFADSPTNLMWRLQNDMSPISRIVAKREEQDDHATYTEFKLDVHGDSPTTSSANLRKF
jgi:twitching motility protein PilU